jgi:hypothetical protein
VGLFPVSLSINAQSLSINGMSGGVTLATNGIGGELNLLTHPTTLVKNHRITLSFQTVKHARETKVQNTRYVNPKPYIYGKLNAAAVVRLGYSISKQVGHTKANNPSAFFGFSIGPSLGILKPYYIGYENNYQENSGPSILPQNAATIANQDSIYGPANWTLGMNELDCRPGLHFATYFSINWNHSFYFQRWETGIRFDYFPGELEILHLANNKAFTSVYTTYILGKQQH